MSQHNGLQIKHDLYLAKTTKTIELEYRNYLGRRKKSLMQCNCAGNETRTYSHSL